MIDWGSLAANSLWVLGCALALAVFSYASWLASLTEGKLNAQFKQPMLQTGFSLAGFLFCAGLALTADSLWMVVLWAAPGGFFLIELVEKVRAVRRVGRAG